MAGTISITKNANNSTITIFTGNGQYNDIYISKCDVYSTGNNVALYWDELHFIEADYTEFAAPTGASAAAVQAAIAALLVLPAGGGSISGSIASPQVAYGTGSNKIGGDSTFLFNNDGNKELTVNKAKLSPVALLSSPKEGYLEYDGANLYFTIGAGASTKRYIINLSLA